MAYKILIVICVYLLFGLLLQHTASASINNENKFEPYQSQHGAVWLLPADGVYIKALQQQTQVDYKITGHIARATVKQKFTNNSSLWVEGIYVFPLPENSAVDHFRIIIGERIIEGEIREHEAAKKAYHKAKITGKKASLIIQQRPNVFTTLLSNIAPGEEMTIEFEFQQILTYKNSQYRLRFPLVVAPRYQTNQLNKPAEFSQRKNFKPKNTNVLSETDTTTDTNNPVKINLSLDAGFSLMDLYSSYHHIDIQQTSETHYSISTTGETIKSNRDFELVWQPQLDDTPQLAAFTENIDGEHYTMLTLLPPDLSYLQQKIPARDLIFVIDISGSMDGTSIKQAKSSLIIALDGLSSIDRFNIIWFNHETGQLFQNNAIANTQNKTIAKNFINSLSAGGGTEMLPALELALSGIEEFSRFRQVIFITDGNISNEAALFNVIEQKLADNRLFTIGIGSAPNAYFMQQAAQKGRGTFTYIGDSSEVQERTATLFKKLENPALINIQLPINNNEYEVFPSIIPDLYAGETTNIVLKGKPLPSNFIVKADYGNIEWQSSGSINTSSHSGIRLAWAGKKIAALMNLQHTVSTNNERESIKEQITETALKHHLVSPYTSLLAVDRTPVNTSKMLHQQRLKNNLPYGWKNTNSTKIIRLAQTASSTHLNILLANIFFIAALFLYWQQRLRLRYFSTQAISSNSNV